MAFLALLVVIFVFKNIDRKQDTKSINDVAKAFFRIVLTPRLMILTLIVAGFWIIQHQLYATMPKYVIRMVGEDAKPEWLANVNPAVVVVSVVLITHWMKKRKAVTSMLVGMVLMPFSALAMSLGPWLGKVVGGDSVTLWVLALHPLTVMMVVGIGIQGLAECFISPRFLEYFSLQAPKGEEGTYLGFSHLHSFISALAGFIMSGFLLDAYCPDPKSLPDGISSLERAAVYANAHHIWYYFAGIGMVSALALAVFWLVTNRIDAPKSIET
jgi:MFS family permease